MTRRAVSNAAADPAPAVPDESASVGIELRNAADLVPYARNSRTHSQAQVAQIAASIAEFGWTNPVLADEQGVVAGHGRILAAGLLYAQGKRIARPNGQLLPDGMVPVIDCAGWSEAKRRAYVIADNSLALAAGWNREMLATELEELATSGFDLDILAFTDDDMRSLQALWGRIDELGAMPALPTGDRAGFQTMTFTLSNAQADAINLAVQRAKDAGPFDESVNQNSNGNALTRVCEAYK